MRGARIQDGYPHLFIEHPRPDVAMLHADASAARQLPEAEKPAGKPVEKVRSDTPAARGAGVIRHGAQISA